MVTAQKREQAVTDVAATVAAFTGEDLRANGIDTPKDVAFLVPNVDIKGTQGDANPAVTIRGVGMNNFNSNNNPGGRRLRGRGVSVFPKPGRHRHVRRGANRGSERTAGYALWP